MNERDSEKLASPGAVGLEFHSFPWFPLGDDPVGGTIGRTALHLLPRDHFLQDMSKIGNLAVGQQHCDREEVI